MKFPTSSLSSMTYADRNVDREANMRVFRMEKKQDNDGDYPPQPPLVATSKKSTTLSADTPIVELEKGITKAEGRVVLLEQVITAWTSLHTRQFKPITFGPYNTPIIVRLPVVMTAHEQGDRDRLVGRTNQDFDGGETDQAYKVRKASRGWKADFKELKELVDRINARLQAAVDNNKEADLQDDEIAIHDEQQRVFNDIPPELRHQSRDVRANAPTKDMPEKAQHLLEHLQKLSEDVNAVKVIYKTKISGSNLNRYDRADMLKISNIMEKFLRLCTHVAETVQDMPRFVLDSHALKKDYANAKMTTAEINAEDIAFKHVYDKAQQKFVIQLNELNDLRMADKERYSYNLGQF